MANDIVKLRRLMKAANYLNQHQTVLLRGARLNRSQSQGFALHMAWYYERFRRMLSQGIWRFSYFKKEGGIREARGTLDFDIIPEDKRPKVLLPDKRDSWHNGSIFTYYDLDAQAWRSFCLDLFIGFVEQVG